MKERLQKDLRFINKWFIRLIISLVIGMVILALIGDAHHELRHLTIYTGVVYLLLYILSAWLYPSTDKTK